MNEEVLQKHVEAGKILAEAIEYGESLVKPGIKVVDVLDKVEEKILSLGGGLAFPAQISLNEVAAHSCSDLSDGTVLSDQVVKLDCGVHIDGYIADTAVTIDLSGKYGDLIKASQEALAAALQVIKPGVTLGEVGAVIHDAITSYGFAPVQNLSGHGLGRYDVHTKPSVPNFDNGSSIELEEGMVIAVEPFASTGAGVVQESSPATLFTLVGDGAIRDPITRKILQEIKTYQGLPFAKRWLEKKFGVPKTRFALLNLVKAGCLERHAPLVDKSKGMVSQAEHSVIVGKENVVFTKVD